MNPINWIRYAGALIGLWPVVLTMDYDGEVRVRIAWNRSGFGYSCAKILGQVRMCSDGRFFSHGYMTQWTEWRHNRKHVVFAPIPTPGGKP